MIHHSTLFATLSFAIAAKCAIQWEPCNSTEFNTSVIPLECASLEVPLDYTAPEAPETVSLDLIKIPAAGESRGSIMFNLGGPGIATLPDLPGFADIFLPMTGGQFDLVGFDPRGTGKTLPFTCTNTTLEAWDGLSQQGMGNESDVSLGRLWARGAIDSTSCLKNGNDTGPFLSTAFVARDLISIVDALEEDGLLRFWGISYGTTLGATVAAMFPDRIDKLILDGVQNPHEYYRSPAEFEQWTDTDAVFAGMFSTCIEAGLELCALAARNKTGPELEALVWDLLDRIKYEPMVIGGTSTFDYYSVKGTILDALYNPLSWPATAVLLDTLLFGDEAAMSELGAAFVADSTDAETQMLEGWAFINGIWGIKCGDNTARVPTFEEFLPNVEKLYNTSSIAGDWVMARYMLCSQWKIAPRETYEDGFDVTTRNPILILGNTYDGQTSLRSAHNISEGFEGSVVLEINGYGHGSVNVPSTCALEAVSAYWVNGTLPEEGTVCESDAPPYSGITWLDIVSGAGANTAVKRATLEDIKSLKNLKRRSIW